MAQGRRVERVAALIRKEVSELMINGIRDERVHQGMVSITEVEVSGDLQHCKIFVSVFGEAQERDQVLEGCLLYTSPSPRDAHESRMPSSA